MENKLKFFFIFIYWNSQFVQFGHLVEFFNSYINMLMATPSEVPSSRLLGYILYEVCLWGCFLFSLLSMFMVLNVSAASRFGCVANLDLYFSDYLLISSLTAGIPRSLRMSSFLTYHGAFIIVLRILACMISILFIWLIAAVPHSGIPYVQIGFMIVLYIFNLFSMLNLDFRLVSQCICLLVFCTFSIIDLVCSFHVSCVSKWSPRYLTCFVCVKVKIQLAVAS